jgi:hypothetical protein
MKHQRKSQVSSEGREPGFALLLAGVLASGLREWQRNDAARKLERCENKKAAESDSLAQSEAPNTHFCKLSAGDIVALKVLRAGQIVELKGRVPRSE